MYAILLAVLTILGAYAIIVALALSLLFLTHATAPRWMGRSGQARPLFLILNVLIWSLSAAIGGMLVGWLAQWHPIIAAFGLACALFAAILSVALESIGKTSLNYDVTVAACASASVLGGSLLIQLLHLNLTF
jgi:heme A synthase